MPKFVSMGRIFITVLLPLRLEWEPYYYVGEGTVISVGDRVRVAVAGKYYTGVVTGVGVTPDIAESKIRPIASVEPLERISGEEIRLWRFIAEYYMCTVGEVYKAAYPVGRVSEEQAGERIRRREETRNAKALAALARKKATLEERIARKKDELARARKEERRQFLAAAIQELSVQLEGMVSSLAESGTGSGTMVPLTRDIARIELSPAQQQAMERMEQAFADGKVALLEGVTGSGKTEIYCRLAQKVLENGKNVLYLVPEIALSRQLENRLAKVFGNFLLVSHSGETYVHRREVAAAIRGRQYVLLGTRSSIFMPHRDLGLIIVDEEHDTSYKQDNPAPRYNARDCALMMGRIFSSPVVLGSATPSLESLYNASVGRSVRITLSERFYQGGDTEVEVIDTIAERRKRGMVGVFSRKLISHIHDTLGRGEQVLILRGRKAYSPYVQCEGCGDIPRCPHCNVTLSYHRDRERLVCHYCGHSEPYSPVCPKCGEARKPVGTGTQKVEEEVQALFPDARVGRLDGDSMAEGARTIQAFASGTMDILVGTQMVSKGFDFENLTLVAVIQSDSLLGQQDFRADERAVQLLEQLRGRGGRRGKKSLFVIQTSQPEHPVYDRLVSGSDFSSGELAMRSNFGFPPYTRIICLILKDSNLARLEKLSSDLSMVLARGFGASPALIADVGKTAVCVSFPYAPAVDRVSGESIRHIRVTLRRDRNTASYKSRISEATAGFEKDRSWTGHISIDVDPV